MGHYFGVSRFGEGRWTWYGGATGPERSFVLEAFMTKIDAISSVTSVPGLPAKPFGETGSPAITVPAGKHLIVETLSLQLDVTPPGTKLEAFVNYTCGGKNVSLFVPLTYAYSEPSTNYDFYVAMQAVRLYVDPGTAISVSGASPGGSTGTLFVTASGYLI
jgi:hypothetical protein